MTNKMRWSIDFFSCRDDSPNYWDQLCFVGCPVWSRPNFWNIRLRSRKRWIINLLPEMIGQIKDQSPFPFSLECNCERNCFKNITYNNPQKPSGWNELFQKAFVVLTVTLASSLRYPLFNKTSAGCQNLSKGTFLRTLPRQVASICKSFCQKKYYGRSC